MTSPLRTETALILALLGGPGYGLALIERVRNRSRGRIRLQQGAAYPALGTLERRGLVRSWPVNMSRSGRPRTYYELTPAGIKEAVTEREALAGFVAKEPAPVRSRRELLAMRRGLEECFDVSEFASTLERGGRARGL
ncbi:MAG: helix-turn-helix transcriptional regulator [Acidobacteria bacterium]|nr:helix-turn-helix transcriptional regulator [Acidobacteriota bacterium]